MLAWHPHGDPLLVVLLIVLGTAAFGGLGLLVAGTLRAEVTLAAANLIWLVLLFAGGIAIPLSRIPDARPTTCCSTCRRPRCPTACTRCCRHGSGLPVRALLTLLVWAAVALPAAARWFRWE